jgi:hypothetical protein
MVDNDFRPHDPLPLPDLEAPSMPGERNFRRDVPAPAPAPAQPDPATKEPKP